VRREKWWEGRIGVFIAGDSNLAMAGSSFHSSSLLELDVTSTSYVLELALEKLASSPHTLRTRGALIGMNCVACPW
jgi:hypothetical protein